MNEYFQDENLPRAAWAMGNFNSLLEAVALALNTRPRKTLAWLTPAEAFNGLLRSAAKRSVATTR